MRSGHQSPAGSLTSLYKHPTPAILVFLAVLALGLLFLLPGGLAWAQDAETIEYRETGKGPVATFTAEDPEGTAITWTLEGDDEADFKISLAGVLTFAETPNYEAAVDGDNDNMYQVTVVATDSSYDAEVSTTAGKDTVEVTVEVTNVDEDGTLTLLNRQPVDGIELLTELTDIDSREPNLSDLTGQTWKWEKSTSRTSGWTVIDEATEAMYTPAPADLNNYLRATVTYTDPQGSGKSEMAVSDMKVIAKRSTNTAPVFRNADDEEIAGGTAITREVVENSAAGTNVGAPVAAYDAQGDALTYTIGGTDENSFDINQATGQLMVGAGTMLDFDVEDERSHTVEVTAAGPGHGDSDSDIITVNITVTNVDEDPELTGMDSLRHAENTAIATPVGTYMASDDEDGASSPPTLTLSGTDASDFTLTDTNAAGGGDDDGTYELAFKAMPDFEMPTDAGGNNVYNITVTATDSDGQTDRKNVTVTVTNVEEDGTVTLNTLQPRVGIGVMATLTDLDGATSGVTWKWEAQTDADCVGVSFAEDATDDLEGGISGTYTPTADDIGKCLRATASYTDPQGSDTAMSVLTDSDKPVEADDTNKAPAFPDQDMETDGDQTDQERTVAENTPGDIGAIVEATDPNEDKLTYTLGGTDMASFGIDRGTGQLMTKAMLNKEDKDTYMVTVTAADPSGLSATVNVTIKVTNLDEDPEVTGGDTTVRYGEKRTDAVETYTAEDDEDDKAGKSITWTLEGDDEADFKISLAGVLTFAETPNYEAAVDGDNDNMYQVTVVATDSSYDAEVSTTAGKDTVEVTVEVTNVDEDGTLTLLNRQPVDGIELLTELTDIDSREPNLSDLTGQTWKWEKSTSRTSGWAVIDGAAEAMYTPAPTDVSSYLRATVTYTDPQGSGKSEMAVSDMKVIATRSTNTAPVFRNADDDAIADNTPITREVVENSAAGTNVGAPVAAYDAQGDALTYTIGGTDENSFDINQATGQLMVGAGTMLDFDVEDERSHIVEVTAAGPGHGDSDSDIITVNITVTNVDEDPELTGMDSLRHAENTAIATPVGTYMASDDEDGASSPPTLTLSGTDASDFTLTDTNAAGGGDDDGTYELAFKAMPDFEMPADAGGNNVYNITVTATDSDGQTDRKNVTVTVTNVEEDGTVTLNTLQPRVGIGVMATLTDLDGATSGVTWKWEAQTDADCVGVSFAEDATDDLKGGISGTYTPTADDIGKCLRATASYTDPQGSDTAMSVLTDSDQPVEADDTNKAPAFPDQDMETDGDQTDQERTVEENTAADVAIGAIVEATDPNMDNLTYTLGGTDMASFGIDRGAGQLMTKAMLNKEAKDTYMVTVTAADPSGLSDTINVTIKVTNVDEDPEIMRAPDANVAPEFASATTSRTVAENTDAGEDIGNPVAANGDTLAYTLGGTDAASFDINEDTGQLMTKAALDYESKNSYEVMVTATDPDSASDMITVTITVTNGEEPGEVTLWDGMDPLTTPPQVDDTIRGAVMDPDVPVNVTAWQWAKSMTPDMMDSWMDIQDATEAAYMVTADDTGYHLRVMATYTDAVGTDTAMKYSPATMMVTAIMEQMGAVTLWDGTDALTMAPQVGDTITGLVEDPDGGVTGETWQWSRTMTPDVMASWMDIQDATEAAYMVTADDTGYQLRVMATYMDAVGTDMDMAYSPATMMVTAIMEQMGAVTLWDGTDALTMAPQVGDTITGLVEDPDGGVTGETWQWSRTMTPDVMASWMDIQDATEAAYMVTADDTGYQLRVMATYMDAVGTDMDMAYSPATMMVTMAEEMTLLGRYDTTPQDGSIQLEEARVAVGDYFVEPKGSVLSLEDAREVVGLYFEYKNSQ